MSELKQVWPKRTEMHLAPPDFSQCSQCRKCKAVMSTMRLLNLRPSMLSKGLLVRP